MEEILLEKPGKKIILLGNEAIVRAALEAGVNFVATYPGTPASEIGDTFYRLTRETGVYFEYSVNEKVALEAAIGASFSGLKTLVAMKSFGLNVASDSLLPLCYTGLKGAMVIVVGDDPSCWSSAQSEQDSRAYSYLAHLPTLQPADPQECKDFTKLAFEISEKFKIPVMIRTTTRVAHQRMPVKLEKFKGKRINYPKGEFIKEPKKFVTMPPRVLEMKKELLEKIEKIKEFLEKSKINQIYRASSPVGVITSGISYLYVREALKELNLKLPILKLGFFYPLAEEKIKNFIRNLKKVLIVEELENYLEKEVEKLAKSSNPALQIFGKNLLPRVGEFRSEIVISALTKILGKKYQLKIKSYLPTKLKTKHLPRFCPGCPFWQIFSVIKKVAPKNSIFGGDIGCYMIASLTPHNLYDYLSCMGSSIGIGHGISKLAKNQKIITFIGDSTFFHAGIPALINTVFNKSDPLIIILDNGTTAMTGHQPYPGSAIRADSQYQYEWESYLPAQETPEKPIKIEDIILACGVKNLKIVDSFKADQIAQALKEFLPKKEVSVIIARGMCALLAKSLK